MTPRLVKCPTCERPIEWATSPFRPFCSERCRLLDLGAWLTEKRGIAGDASADAGAGEEPTVDPAAPRSPKLS